MISAVYDMNDDGAEDTMAELMAGGVEVTDFRGKLIMPGFVDGHAHAPQVNFLLGVIVRLSTKTFRTAEHIHPALLPTVAKSSADECALKFRIHTSING